MIAGLAPYVAGKTSTSDDENDAWFVGFTNDVTVAVWVGYDNADGKRRTLGGGSTGGAVAVPIFDSIIHAVWANVTLKTELAGRRLKLTASSSVNRLISNPAISALVAVEVFLNASASMPRARYLIHNTSCCRAKPPQRMAKSAYPESARAPRARPIRNTRSRTPRSDDPTGRARQPRQRSCSKPLFVE